MLKKYIALLVLLIFSTNTLTGCAMTPLYSRSNSHANYEHQGAVEVGDKVKILTIEEKKYFFIVSKITEHEYIGAYEGQEYLVEFHQIKEISKANKKPILGILALIVGVILIVAFVNEVDDRAKESWGPQ